MNDSNDRVDVFGLIDMLAGKAPEDARTRRSKTRGMPDEQARRQLAETYLQVQHRLFPELVKTGVIPKKTEANVAAMAEDFRKTFELDMWKKFDISNSSPLWKDLGAGYLRYSDDNSNPRSLDQQLLNVLEMAKRHGIFIPWNYVFADSAISGTIAARRGYMLAKRVMEAKDLGVGSLGIDEIGRAGRDAIELLSLGRLIETLGKRMIGATDGFDSILPMSRMQLHMFAMIHEFFVQQLRDKVKRGMRDAFALGKTVFNVCVGYKFVPVVDEAGHPVLDHEGRVVKERVIDEEEAKALSEGAEWYARHSWSRDKIAMAFNERKVGGYESWDSTTILQVLERSVYRGVEYYEMTYKVRDKDGNVTIAKRPKSEWKRREVEHLRIFSDELGDLIDARLARSREIYKKAKGGDKPSRTEMHPKTLVRPYCAQCRKPMILGKSGKYASYFCLQGKTGKQGCRFTGFKAANIIDTCVVEKVAQELFVETFVSRIVDAANAQLNAEPEKSGKVDVAAIRRQLDKKQKFLKRVNDGMAEEDQSNLKSVFETIRKTEVEIATLKENLAKVETRTLAKAAPLTVESVKVLLADLRGLLREDVGAAAPALAALTGPVVVTQETKEPGGETEWKARFKLNAVPILVDLARRRSCPTVSAWELLNTGGWAFGNAVEVWLQHTPKYEMLASQAMALEAEGASVDQIAAQLKTTWDTANKALAFGKAGGVTPTKVLPPRVKKGKTIATEIIKEIVRLHDVEMRSFSCIAVKLGIDHSTVTRNYKRAKQDGKKTPIPKKGDRKGGRYTLLPKETFERMERLFAEGMSPEKISAELKCGRNTVYRHRDRMKQGQ